MRILGRLQRAIEALYRVKTPFEVGDFIISDEERAALGLSRTPGEQLVLRHDPAGPTGPTLDVGLFVDELSLRRLPAAGPIDEEQLPALLLAVEGVSHFVYVMLRAEADRPFSALELELQAEVDKFVLLFVGRRAGRDRRASGALRERLFQRVRYHADLSPEERDRYSTANTAAGEYAASLEERFVRHGAVDDMLDEVRRFYRLDCAGKLDHIARKAA